MSESRTVSPAWNECTTSKLVTSHHIIPLPMEHGFHLTQHGLLSARNAFHVPFSQTPCEEGEFTKTNGLYQPDAEGSAGRFSAAYYTRITIWLLEQYSSKVVKLFGRLDLAASNGGHPTELVNDSYTVWNNDMRFQCPPSLPFSLIFPSTFKDGELNTWPLPPSIRITPPCKPFVYVKCFYTISVFVSTALHPRFSLWRDEKILTIPVNFQSTAYPPRPIMPNTNLLATVKSAPDEWCEILCKVGSKLQVNNIHCSLFIPSALIYGVADIHTISFTDHWLARDAGRTLSFFVRGQKQHRNIDMGEGILSALPPPITYPEESGFSEAAIDWAGVVQCDDDLAVGTFDAGTLYIEDFIVVSIPAWNAEHKHPIRFYILRSELEI
ncbi:hypothetical protein C8F04DRAFT_1272292 [Mycena alexandri]|uniref:Uncharacterized protein n=1 Tax=Mycena alexandri TaxID=1745969 RepID=A0AAD6S9S5_9AGAR|nr:hypothetical protein C8F04DRAFT_1272292 [Mycena alexandri]